MLHLILCVACLATMAAFIAAERAERYVAGVALKGCASLIFVILGAVCASAAPEAEAGYARLIVVGLAIGAVADVVLNLRYVYEKVGQLLFALGTVVFLVGHVVYTTATYPRVALPWIYLVAGGALTVVLMHWIFQRIEAKAALKVIGVFYIGIVVVLNCLALGALVTEPSAQAAVFLLGALLFLASDGTTEGSGQTPDIILILNTFAKRHKQRFGLRICNLTLYYIGQLLIALSLGLLA